MVRAKFPQAFQFLFEPHRYKGVRGGRGKGASWAFARALLILGTGDVPNYQRPLRILCARETQRSIADSVHTLLRDQIGALGLREFYEVQQNTILGRNGTEFIFAGLRHNVANIKSVEACDICWVEEAQSTSKTSWATLIPTIRKDKSEIWLSWNDILATDDTHKRFVLSPPPDAVIKKLTFRDNPWFPEVLRVEMEHLKRTNEAAYQHVWEGDCISEVEGAIFGQEYKTALDAGRIGSVPHNRAKPVTTVWDLGFGDPTAIWFLQAYDGFYNFIDYLESSDETTADYVIKLQNKGYMYGVDWLPHDGIDTIIHGRLNGTGDRTKSIEMLLREAQRSVRIVPKLLVADQINAARLFWNQCRFDATKCADGLQALAYYQWDTRDAKPEELDPRAGRNAETVRKGKTPLHNWASHASSAFMGAAIAVKQPERAETPRPRPQVSTGDHSWMA